MKIQILILLLTFTFITGCNGQSGNKRPLAVAAKIKTPLVSLPKPIYNIYLENSGSMNGYVQSQAEFKETVGNFLTDIEINKLAKSINLNYINSKIIPIDSNIPAFIDSLNPIAFIKAGGQISTTNISRMLKSILDKTSESAVSIFISDCIFSPPRNVPAKNYLVNQQLEIKTNFATKIDSCRLSTIVLQLSSKFDGNYFNYLNQPTKINAQRPYYIWLIGKQEYLVDLFEKVKKESFKGSGIQNFYCAYNSSKSFDYGILNSPKLGYYDRDRSSPKNKIINAAKSNKGTRNGEFQFSVGVNLKSSLLDDKYIMNASNYILPSNYTIEVLKNNIASTNYTHILKLISKSLKTENVSIQLKNNLPQWVTKLNSDNDLIINTADQLSRTFGIKYLVEGVYEAYKTKNNNKDIFLEINISVNQSN